MVLFGGVFGVDVPDCRLGQVRQFLGLDAGEDFFHFFGVMFALAHLHVSLDDTYSRGCAHFGLSLKLDILIYVSLCSRHFLGLAALRTGCQMLGA